jgi:DNA-binding NarL/FixJ family response regulator
MEKYKIVIVDDHKVFRKGLRMVIETQKAATVTDEFASGEQFVEKLPEINCDMVFMDISMPLLDGFETTETALKINPKLKIIGMSANDDIASVNKLLSCGAVGFLSKNANFDEIHDAIKNTAAGDNYFSGNVLIKLSKSFGKAQSQTKTNTRAADLSKREYEVLQLICKGFSNQEIADKLSITDRTVEKHKSNLYLKTDTENILNLVLYAFKNDIVPAP